MEQPIKSELAERYEETKTAYREAFSTVNSSRFMRSDFFESDEDKRAEKLADVREYLAEKAEATARALELIEMLETAEMKKGEQELLEFQSAQWRYIDHARNLEAYEKEPERFSVHALAVLVVMRKAEEARGVKWKKLTNYYFEQDVYRSVHGVTNEEAEATFNNYIEARQMSYTVSTKNLKMRVA
jgi:hypothetical protein